MASIQKEIIIDASPDHVWDALRDLGALHTRLVPDFVTDTKLDGDARIVTFANGTGAREILVDCEDAKGRLVYAIVSERIKQQSAFAQVFAERDGRTRFVWIADVMPNEIAARWMQRWIWARRPCRRHWAGARHYFGARLRDI